MKRIYPILVSLTGVLGLALALAYLGGAYLAMEPEWQAWAEFFMPRALPLLLAPYALLLGHLYLRADLGLWFLRRGWPEETIAYCETRLGHSLGRSRSEAIAHRLALARAYIYLGDYERAEQTLESGYKKPTRGRQALEVARWQLEVWLRRENLVRAHQVWDTAPGTQRPGRARAELEACRAELALREGNQEDYQTALSRAQWKGARLERVRLVEVLGRLRFDDALTAHADAAPDEFVQALIAELDAIAPKIIAEIPGREPEIVATRAKLLYRSGQVEQAHQELARARAIQGDARSHHEVAAAAKLLESADA